MATRSGDLDPGILLHLIREQGYDLKALENLIDRHSGLKGVSDLSGDLRVLHEVQATSPDARLAIAIFCMSVAKAIAGMVVVLGGADTLVFTGGIGEHDGLVRSETCDRLRGLGFAIDEGANIASNNLISPIGILPELKVLPSQEDEQIAGMSATWLLGTRHLPKRNPTQAGRKQPASGQQNVPPPQDPIVHRVGPLRNLHRSAACVEDRAGDEPVATLSLRFRSPGGDRPLVHPNEQAPIGPAITLARLFVGTVSWSPLRSLVKPRKSNCNLAGTSSFLILRP